MKGGGDRGGKDKEKRLEGEEGCPGAEKGRKWGELDEVGKGGRKGRSVNIWKEGSPDGWSEKEEEKDEKSGGVACLWQSSSGLLDCIIAG